MEVAPPRWRLTLAYATVYLVWGASYLSNRLAVESFPPLPMAGARFILAGALLTLVALFLTGERAGLRQWRSATIAGSALVLSNAAVAYAVQRIPSGVAALLVALTPCWVVLLEWWRDRSRRPHPGVVAGLLLGLGGIAILVEPGHLLGAERIDVASTLAVIAGTLIWAAGSVYSRTAARPRSAALLSGMQMLGGGVALTLFCVAVGLWSDVAPATATARSWIGFWYLVLVASIGGFTAYVYLLEHASPARATTYAYVNPVVAVTLGAVFLGEPLTTRMLLAAATIVTAVALIVTWGASGARTAVRQR